MATDSFPSFSSFFQACHGFKPYVWQQDLADAVATSGQWPQHIDVPTGLGKTSCVDVAVYELARQVHLGLPRTAPMRIFHVIERRAVVDDALGHIQQLSEGINTKAALSSVKKALESLCGGGDDQAVIATSGIHGGRRDDRQWLRATGCTIVTMTAHQFVSRLLFRGYGVSSGTRSIHAGLCGVDRLVLFDEPHLAAPALTAIRDAERLQSEAESDLGVPAGSTVLLGATVPPTLLDEIATRHGLDPANETASALKRVNASRPVKLEALKSSSDTAHASALANLARKSWTSGSTRIAVMVNTIALAQQVSSLLDKAGNVPTPQLVTSRVRDTDRANLDTWETGIIVSTQCLEVGVDISFDTLITEACPYPSLVQRLGRLNRDGDTSSPRAFLIHGPLKAGVPTIRKATAAVYSDEPVLETLKLLMVIERTEDGTIDLSIAAQRTLYQQLGSELQQKIWGTPKRCATLHRGFVSLMTQTKPTPQPDLPVGAFINGPDSTNDPEVSVSWRADLDLVTLCPPLPVEEVSVPVYALKDLIGGRREQSDSLNDTGVQSVTKPSNTPWTTSPLSRIRIFIEDQWRQPKSLAEIVPGSRVVLEAKPRKSQGPKIGGYSRATGWDPRITDEVPDHSIVGAVATLSRNPDAAVSFPLTHATLNSYVSERGEDDEDLSTAVDTFFSKLGIDQSGAIDEELELTPEDLETAVQDILAVLIPDVDMSRLTTTLTDSMCVVASLRNQFTRGKASKADVYLANHLAQVEAWTRDDARRTGLDADMVEQLAFAGRLHDSGKSWTPYQQSFGYDVNVGGELLAKPHAKSVRVGSRGVPVFKGWRHEAMSVYVSREQGASTLTEHVVGSHHGWYRPMMPPEKGVCQGLGVSRADVFAGLNRQWGPWGLAYLESIMRLADWRASAYPDESYTGQLPTLTASTDELSPADIRSPGTALTGLSSHPMTGWFAAIGLLTAAVELGDSSATLHWKPLIQDDSAAPVEPVISTTFDLAELVDYVCVSDQWEHARKLVSDHTDCTLDQKSQKIGPATSLRGLLRAAEDSQNNLVLGLVGDTGGLDSDRVVMPIVPAANNSSYTGTATRALNRESAETIRHALTDVTSGFADENCDGGMDRHDGEDPYVTGIGQHGTRRTRAALAPLAVFGMAGLGAAPPLGHGVVRRRPMNTLRLPTPTQPVTLDGLRALLNSAWYERFSDPGLIGIGWNLEYKFDSRDKSIQVWVGGPRNTK